MSTRLARFTLAIALTACSATPELKFGDNGGGEPDATTDAPVNGTTDATTDDAAKPTGGRDAQGGGTDDATFADGAPNDDAEVDAGEGDATVVDAAKPHDAAVAPDASVHDASVPDTYVPDSGVPPFDASTFDAGVCKPNLQFGIDCCPNGDQCVGLACQNCQDCSNCGLPNFCCAIVNGGGKYKGMKCSATSVGCP